MDEKEELRRRQETVKSLLANYADALRLNEQDSGHSDELLERLRLRLEERGLPLYAEEVLTGITLIETFLDFSGQTSYEELQTGMLSTLLALLGEVQDRWREQDSNFFLA